MENKIRIFEINIDSFSLAIFLEKVKKILAGDKQEIISYVNIHALCLSSKNPRLINFFRSSEIVFCDGFGVRVAARILGYPPPERYTPPDFIDYLADICVEQGYSIFFLGAKPGVSELAAETLKAAHPKLLIAGTAHGYFNKMKECEENQQVIDIINQACPDILFVGFGMPSQEYWIEENRINLNVKVLMPVGALIDYVAQQVRRAPKWMTDHGLEWLGRLIIEPQRLWKRYLFEIPRFFYLVFREAYTNKYHRKEG
jgi:N-acetylglucosaminyldiphosphoundecaprenol N-acetyl-beta-D-mannosaminyltransferase